ncbi:MAG: ABC transporter transmembrane domain-containing protein [Pseudomonadota bacterium]
MASSLIKTVTKTDSARLMRRLLVEYMWPLRWRFAAALMFMLLVAGTTAASAYLMEPMINDIFAARRADLLLPISLAILAIFFVKGVSAFSQAYLMNDIGRRITATMQVQVFQKLMRSDLARFHDTASGRLISHMTYDVSLMFAAVSGAVTAFGKDLMTLIGLIAVMIYLDWELFLFGGIAFPIAIYPIIAIGRHIRRLTRISQDQAGELTSQLSQVFQGIRHVKANNAEERETQRASKLIWEIAEIRRRTGMVQSISHPIMETLAGFAIAGVVFYGGYQVINDLRQPGTLFAFITALLLAYEPLKRLTGLNAILQQGFSGAERVFETLDRDPSIKDPPDGRVLPRVRGAIRFENVWFSYGENIPALLGVDIEVEAGTTVALVGPSGAGKSTILNLIPRFYDTTNGRVLIDGVDIRDATVESTRDNLALVSQEITLFDDTVASNIAYSRPDASQEEIQAAAKAAAADDFIQSLPDGYETVVGEHGVRLSGGQRQRLSIARAMLKNAPILLLDEATSALDTESERQIQAALEELMRGRTTIAIAHRLSTIVRADLIYVLSEGRVVEKGKHGELIARGGLYAKLWAMQTREEDGDETLLAAGQ